MRIILQWAIYRVSGGPLAEGIVFGIIHGSVVFLASFGAGVILAAQPNLHDLVPVSGGFAGAVGASWWLCFRTAPAVFDRRKAGVFYACLAAGWILAVLILYVFLLSADPIIRPYFRFPAGFPAEEERHLAISPWGAEVLVCAILTGALAIAYGIITTMIATFAAARDIFRDALR